MISSNNLPSSSKIKKSKPKITIDIVFLWDLYAKRLNYFIDLKNIYRVKYHTFQWDRYMCSQTWYDKREICKDIECLFCSQQIDEQIIIYCDILIFDEHYKYDNNKILLLSEREYQSLLLQKKLLFCNSTWLDTDKIYSLFTYIKDNKSLQIKKIRSYEYGVRTIMNLTKNYGW